VCPVAICNKVNFNQNKMFKLFVIATFVALVFGKDLPQDVTFAVSENKYLLS